MTDKKLHFPSMDEGDDDSSDLYYQNDSGEYVPYDSGADEWDDLFYEDGTDDDDTGGDAGVDHSGDSILAGERAAYERTKKLIGSADEFDYFPSDAGEENNRKFAMAHLQKEWGGNTSRNIGVARFFFKNFLDEGLIKEAHNTGIGSHPIMISAFYRAARSMEKQVDSKGEGTKRMKFKGMHQVTLQKIEEKTRDLAISAYTQAKDEIIRRHGGISHGG